MSDRDRRLCELMGMCWHEADYMLDGKWDKNCLHYYVPCRKCKLVLYSPDKTVYNPDFTTPEWRARLIDWAVEQEWWGAFFRYATDEMSSKLKTHYMYITDKELFRYLWRNLPDLVSEYWEGRK